MPYMGTSRGRLSPDRGRTGGVAGGFRITTRSLPPATDNQGYSFQLASEGGEGEVTWTLTDGALPDGLTLSDGGLISGTVAADESASSPFTVEITATDETTATAHRTFELVVWPPPPIITNESLPNAVLGVPYSAEIEYEHGLEPVLVTLVAGTLPPGLAYDPDTRLITGTPTGTVEDTYPVTVKAVDATGNPDRDDEVPLSIETELPPPPEITNESLPSVDVGVAYTPTEITVADGLAPVVVTLHTGSLPAGMSFNSGTRLITGTPTASGTFPVTFRATDDAGRFDDKELSIEVVTHLVSFQKGEQVVTGNTSATIDVTVSEVDVTKALLMFNITSLGSSLTNICWTGEVLNSTTIRFTRNGTTSTNVRINWYLIQRNDWTVTPYIYGTADLDPGVNNKTITEVDTAIAFPVVCQSQLVNATSATSLGHISRSQARVGLTTSTNLQLEVLASTESIVRINVQIVQWTGATVGTVTGTPTSGPVSGYSLSASMSDANSMTFFTQSLNHSTSALGNHVMAPRFVGGSTLNVYHTTILSGSKFTCYVVQHPGIATHVRDQSQISTIGAQTVLDVAISSTDVDKTSVSVWPRLSSSSGSGFPAWLFSARLTSATQLRLESYTECTHAIAWYEVIRWR